MRLDIDSPLGADTANANVRRHVRGVFSVPLTLQHLNRGSIQTTRGITLDISEGGVGALVQGGLRVGEMVELQVCMPEHPLRTVAIVRYTSCARSGFEFLGLTPEERQQISGVIGNC
jgi:c-di-GMP-binding flagellar brake protein YcgR